MAETNEIISYDNICMRQVQDQDLETIVQIHKACFGKGYTYLVYNQMVSNYPIDYTALAYIGNKPVGLISISWGVDQDQFYGNITTICVIDEYRGHGIGNKLMKYILIMGKEADFLSLNVRVDNSPAIHLYEKYGFKFVCTVKNYYVRDGKDGFYYKRIQKNHPPLNLLSNTFAICKNGRRSIFPKHKHQDDENNVEPVDLSDPKYDPSQYNYLFGII